MTGLAAVVEALISMDPARIVSAEHVTEALRTASPEDLRRHDTDLRNAAVLARAANEYWRGMAAISALNSGGYSALGLPAAAPDTSGGMHG